MIFLFLTFILDVVFNFNRGERNLLLSLNSVVNVLREGVLRFVTEIHCALGDIFSLATIGGHLG